MKRRITAIILALVLICAVGAPAFAADYGVIYDETEELSSEYLTYLGEMLLPMYGEELGIDIRVDVLTFSEYENLKTAAEDIYGNYGYGYGEYDRGVTLTLLLDEQEGTFVMNSEEDWCVYVGGSDPTLQDGALQSAVEDAVEPYLESSAWSGDMETSAVALAQAVEALADAVNVYFLGDFEPEEGAPVGDPALGPVEGDDLITVPEYIFDEYDLLTYDEIMHLDDMAREVIQRHDCGVYVMIVDDYTRYGSGDVIDVAGQLYDRYDLGEGDRRSGVMLLLSMDERDYAIYVMGAGEDAMGSYVRDMLAERFKDDFADNNWSAGLEDYIRGCDEFLTPDEQDGSFYEEDSGGEVDSGGIIISIVVGCLVALIVCLILKGKMNTAVKAVQADEYVVPGGIAITNRWDCYTHTTTTVRTIEDETSSSSSDSSHSTSSGGSGSSGKF